MSDENEIIKKRLEKQRKTFRKYDLFFLVFFVRNCIELDESYKSDNPFYYPHELAMLKTIIKEKEDAENNT